MLSQSCLLIKSPVSTAPPNSSVLVQRTVTTDKSRNKGCLGQALGAYGPGAERDQMKGFSAVVGALCPDASLPNPVVMWALL